jgi:GNAT superfamily N-acetyltransferase
LAGMDEFIFRPLDPNDKINKFEIERENDALRAFLKKAAPRFHASNIAKTYVAIETGDGQKRVRSYISILNSWIRKEYANIEDCPEAEKYDYPAVKIARLATDRHYENRGLGKTLIELVCGVITTQIMPHSGCRFLILDANREKIDFYKRRGFTLVNNDENLDPVCTPNPVMFMDLHKIVSKKAAK